MINLLETLDKIMEVVLKTGQMQKDNIGRKELRIDKKTSNADLSTEIDKKSEEMIIEFITSYYPSHGILSEESGLTTSYSDYIWVIDPLDGTTNYAQGLPIFVISVALQHKGETVLSVVYAPMLEQLFTAIKGQGAYLNGQQLSVSNKTELSECVLATGFPYDIATNPINNINYFYRFQVEARGVRCFESAVYNIACVAAGKFDGFWELNLCPWDVAAASLIVEEAGGKIIHFRNDRNVSIIAGNEIISQKIHEQIKKVDTEEC